MNPKNKNKYARGNVADFLDTRGYFIGKFMGKKGFPLLETEEVEVAWRILPAAFDDNTSHYHKRGVEIMIVASGSYKVRVNGEDLELIKSDFIVVYPETHLKSISAEEGTELIVIKAPSLENDKFYT